MTQEVRPYGIVREFAHILKRVESIENSMAEILIASE